jgi:hypothetical protein
MMDFSMDKSDHVVPVLDQSARIDSTHDATYDGTQFFPIGTHRPVKGQVIASYAAMAEFIDGEDKRVIVEAVQRPGASVLSAVKLMRKRCHATEVDATRVLKEIIQDLQAGMSVEEVLVKPYRFTLELFYYTEPKNIPEDDLHWSQITLLQSDKFSVNIPSL